jgi:demethylmenaquinone methyltransferase/2-methoxy-6-polyprenyl-1,4-benzoquinol methylase
METRNIAQDNYDRLSRWYDLLSGSSEQPVRLRGLHVLDSQPGERILEIGCGTGAALPLLAPSTNPSGTALGCDISLGMLAAARSKLKTFALPNVFLLQGDACCLPFAHAALDAIFMSFTLELFPEMEIPVVLQECKRVLRPGGRMGVVALLHRERPGMIEQIYVRVHRQWPRLIDCRPIPIAAIMQSAALEISHLSEMSMWGLPVGIVLAYKTGN